MIESLSDFFAVFHSLLDPTKIFWFRGHSLREYQLCPSALRYKTEGERQAALDLIGDMKRFLEWKLPRPPEPTNELGWMQVAQHHGLPTRLLDWTQNAAVALFFACCSNPGKDGLVAVLNPIELNQQSTSSSRILTLQRDEATISKYMNLDGVHRPRHKTPTIAINPTWNNERIAMQQGAFTLHGSAKFELGSDQAKSLILVPILKEHKLHLLSELERVGIGEMFIFPEPEYVCSHLRRGARL